MRLFNSPAYFLMVFIKFQAAALRLIIERGIIEFDPTEQKDSYERDGDNKNKSSDDDDEGQSNQTQGKQKLHFYCRCYRQFILF